jgi:uroporphyrinogen III methyltransferase/synthase
MSDKARSDRSIAALSGIGVLVTRDVRQASDLTAHLKALGADVFEYPVIEIAKPFSTEPLDRSISMLESYDWIVFASTNSVDFFTDRMQTLNIRHNALGKTSVAAIGAKTADRARLLGLKVDFHPQNPRNFSATDFVREFCKAFEPAQKKILWPRTNVGELNIKELLEERGASVDAVIAYETVLPAQTMQRRAELKLLIESGKVKVITLTSSQSARNLHHLLQPSQGSGVPSAPAPSKLSLPGISIAAIGAQTRETVEQLFDCKCFQSESATIEGLVTAVIKHSQKLKGSP